LGKGGKPIGEWDAQQLDRCYDFFMKIILLALCLAVIVISVGFIFPKVGGQFVIRGPTPTPADIRSSVFKGLPRGLQ
jgi:hypothetical protein